MAPHHLFFFLFRSAKRIKNGPPPLDDLEAILSWMRAGSCSRIDPAEALGRRSLLEAFVTL